MQEGHTCVHERNRMREGTSTVGCCGCGGWSVERPFFIEMGIFMEKRKCTRFSREL